MLKICYAPTVASAKVLILLEELNLPYQKIPINIRKKVNHYPEYKLVVPTIKTPALLDEGKVCIESSNILLYLATKYGKLFDANNVNEILTWLFWETSELSPQCLSYYRIGANFPDYKDVKAKYLDDLEGAVKIINTQLEGKDYIATNYSIADLACFPWISYYNKADVFTFISKYSNVLAWLKRMESKESVQKVNQENAKFDWEVALTPQELVEAIKA
jgi:GST-like protein